MKRQGVLWLLVAGLSACGAANTEPGAEAEEASQPDAAVAAGGAPGTGGSSAKPGTGGAKPGTGGAQAGSGGAPPAAGGGSAGTVCGKVVYDGETVTLGSAVTWTDPNGANGSSSITESTTNPHGGTTSMKIDLKWNSGYYGGAFGYNFGGYSESRAIDVSGAENLEFWARTETGTNDHFVLWIGDSAGTASSREKSGGYVPLVTTTWQKFDIPLSALTGVNLGSIWEVDGDTHSNPFGSAGGVTFYLDDVVFTSSGCN